MGSARDVRAARLAARALAQGATVETAARVVVARGLATEAEALTLARALLAQASAHAGDRFVVKSTETATRLTVRVAWGRW